MVFYYTSANIKLLRNILHDYETRRELEVTQYEYMQEYIKKCPAEIEDAKLNWIVDTFLKLKKHLHFLRKLAYHLSDELSEEEQEYFILVMQAFIFELKPKNLDSIYKTLFNLSKTLLNTFTAFLSNNEVLTFISDVAQNYYDATYITEEIIAPLFIWQPYLSEMAHRYAEYIHVKESRKIKPPTIPTAPTFMNRKVKKVQSISTSQPNLPKTPQNSTQKNRKMLTKSAIDRKLKSVHEQNKQHGESLLKTVQDNHHNYARPRPVHHHQPTSTGDAPKAQFFKLKPKKNFTKSSLPPVKDNNATVKRINNIVKRTEQEEIQWLQDLFSCCRNYKRIEQLIEQDRKASEQERLYDIEKKHLMGQISHEEAILAKKKIEEENKKKFDQFCKEKELWDKSIEEYRKQQLKKAKSNIKECSILEFRIKEARHAITKGNKELAYQKRIEAEIIKNEIMKAKKEELEDKINIIKQIKMLEIIAKKSRLPKLIDLTETSGVGLLCEMSIAELQERLAAVKIDLKEEIERKRDQIREKKETAKKVLKDAKNSVKEFFDERTEIKKLSKDKKKPPVTLKGETKCEIDNLKKILEQKREMRRKLLE